MRLLRHFTLGFLILISLMSICSSGQAKGPQVEFMETEWDFGRIKQGEVVRHEFVFRNIGTAPLEIRRVTTSCGCAAALVSEKKIAPGQQGALKVSFDSRGYSGKVIKYIYFESNDQKNPQIGLAIKAEVEVGPGPKIEIDPLNLDLGIALEGEAAEAKIKIKNRGELELTFDIDNPAFDFFVQQKKISLPYKIPAGREIELTVKIPARKGLPGLQREYLLVKSNDPSRPTLSVFISRYIVTQKELRQLFQKYRSVLEIK
ncbi:MAG: DUF1573 domain-containing protein [Acidobacteriota bacterium]|nr:DUF1573 domain-containing protein [Acidobacteriota bacterium]MDW3228370.1 DUF1573 domain-containing protein [Acidobacteriota bacterium]MDY0231965.1 DUF1573 domain-containing protein [Candidatus Saccharicenans sp.]